MQTLAIFLTLTSLPLFAEPFDAVNHPDNFRPIIGGELVYDLGILPDRGTLNDTRLGWSESYWPSHKGGIAYRWNHPNPNPFRYKLLTKKELKSLDLQEMGQLSPAELYDISQGDYGYSLTRRVLSMYTPRDLWWEGICHGWAQASANYPEPAKTVVVNPDGLQVPFGSSDVKALLAMHDAFNSLGEYARVGERCTTAGKVPGEATIRDLEGEMPPPEAAEAASCRDVNAGAFHVIITNLIGIHSRSFVADVDRFADVWNQPVTGYETEILQELTVTDLEATQGISRRILIRTKMVYAEELQFWTILAQARGDQNFVSKDPVTNTSHQAFRSKVYEYVLELDGNDRILGGEWVSRTRPDFLWQKKRDPKFVNGGVPLSGLNGIYRPVRR